LTTRSQNIPLKTRFLVKQSLSGKRQTHNRGG
jgi:hypothetical protein